MRLPRQKLSSVTSLRSPLPRIESCDASCEFAESKVAESKLIIDNFVFAQPVTNSSSSVHASFTMTLKFQTMPVQSAILATTYVIFANLEYASYMTATTETFRKVLFQVDSSDIDPNGVGVLLGSQIQWSMALAELHAAPDVWARLLKES